MAEEREEDQQQREGEGENEGNPHDESNDATEGDPGALPPHPGEEPEPENPEVEPEPEEPLTQEQQFLLVIAAIIFTKSNLHQLADAYKNAKNLVQLMRDEEAAEAVKAAEAEKAAAAEKAAKADKAKADKIAAAEKAKADKAEAAAKDREAAHGHKRQY